MQFYTSFAIEKIENLIKLICERHGSGGEVGEDKKVDLSTLLPPSSNNFGARCTSNINHKPPTCASVYMSLYRKI